MAEDVFEIVGTVVGGAFNVEAVVAEGGFAVVYRAYHGAFHAPVALKCLKVPTVARTSQRDFLERFREEGELLFRLSQSIPSVVRPLHIDAFETPKGVFVPYMALEWLEGETLDVIIARRSAEGRPPMAIKPVIRLLSPVARALARAHKFPGPKGPVSIVHRDLKPDNIVVANINGEEVVKILDFGIAKVKSVATQAAGRQSQEGGQIPTPFTPGYAAPEQWFPKRFGQTGPWTDVWGLALTTVEALTGKAAIDGDHAAMMGTAIDEKRRPSPRSEGARVPDEVEQVFLKALAVDPRDRYRDIGEFWDALEAAVGMQRSLTPATGFTPQPLRDPRSEGEPHALSEMIEAAVDSQRGGPRAVGMTDAQRRSDTPPDPRAAAPPVPHVPDLELSVELKAPPSPPAPRRADSTSKMRAVREADLSKPSSKPGAKGDQEPAEPMVLSAADVMVAPGVTKANSGSVQITELQVGVGTLAESVSRPGAGGASGLDLAVSPDIVRRASQHKMQAVSVQQLSDAGLAPPPPSRAGQPRALNPQPAPSSSVLLRPLSQQKPTRKMGTPIGLIVVGLLISLAFYANASMGGGRWALGPVPINWIAGIFVVAGTALLLVRVFWREEQ